jgi:TrmH family RNA methyltransferase
MISSAQNPNVRLARSLAGRSRERHEAKAFLAEGVRLVEEALAAHWPFRFVFHSDELSERGGELLKRIKEQKIPVDEVPARLLATISDTETSQGILAVLDAHPIPAPRDVDFILIVDAVREPGNLGTLLRTADAAGVEVVLLAPGTADAFAPKVVRAGMGAHFRLPLKSMDWPEIRQLAESMQLNICLADMDGKACWEADLRPPVALIVGGEAEGASQQARELARQTVSIPMQGKADSLNAAVAGSILMFEVVRQRNARG